MPVVAADAAVALETAAAAVVKTIAGSGSAEHHKCPAASKDHELPFLCPFPCHCPWCSVSRHPQQHRKNE